MARPAWQASEADIAAILADSLGRGCPKAPARAAYRLRAANAGGTWEFDDPFSFGPTLGETNDYLLIEGTHQTLYERLGAHPTTLENVDGAYFAV